MASRGTTRITRHESDDGAIVRVEGRLGRESLPELLALVSPGDSHARVTIDISGLLSVDDLGLRSLNEMRCAGRSIVGGSLYIRLLLGGIQP